MSKVGFGVKYFGVPTPRLFRILGDSIVYATGTVTLGSIMGAAADIEDPEVVQMFLYIAMASTLLTMLGNFLVKFFGEIETAQERNMKAIYQEAEEQS
jgi:hypothetical protein